MSDATSDKSHWQSVYRNKGDNEISWTQPEPRLSLSLIHELAPRGASVIDVGGGSSLLAQRLLDDGYRVAVLDISPAALERARERLRGRAAQIRWIEADITRTDDVGRFDIWHDRAAFHFLTEPGQRARYIELLEKTVPIGGHAIIATFAPDGPDKCSGLPVRRYDGVSLARELGSEFELLKSIPELHHTPWGAAQSFQYSVLRRLTGPRPGA
jgi:SAM-dependent methyltransferase